jgi:hypothetical protein
VRREAVSGDGATAHRPSGASSRVTVYVGLELEIMRLVDREAQTQGLTRAGWVRALVRRRVLGTPTFSPAETQVLFGVRQEIRRIGVSVNQIVRVMNTAVLEGRALDTELHELQALRLELRAHLQGLAEAFEGKLDYWAVSW